jgi:hypothetical protein
MQRSNLTEQFGRVKELIEVKPNSPISLLIGKWIDDSIKRSKKMLQDKGRNASGTLSASITPLPQTIDADGNMEWTIEMNDYWKFIDEGVNGTKTFRNSTMSFRDKAPPAENIQDWIISRGIKPLNGGTDAKDYEQMIRFIQKRVKEKGIEKTEFVSLVFNEQQLDTLMKDIEALWQ